MASGPIDDHLPVQANNTAMHPTIGRTSLYDGPAVETLKRALLALNQTKREVAKSLPCGDPLLNLGRALPQLDSAHVLTAPIHRVLDFCR